MLYAIDMPLAQSIRAGAVVARAAVVERRSRMGSASRRARFASHLEQLENAGIIQADSLQD
ncbi:hypothetical protein JS562_52310, partial [Agrobacterium sp. S2]|nr:hypothetical protein [Agrobacterium sp. S2]